MVPAGAAWHQLCAKWGWVEAVDLSVHTLLGIYDPKWHSVEALMRAARHAWHQDLWNQDGRTVGAGPLGLRALVLQEHANLAERSNRLAFRVTTASAVDGRTLGYVGNAFYVRLRRGRSIRRPPAGPVPARPCLS